MAGESDGQLIELVKRYQQGNPESGQKLLAAVGHLARSIAASFARPGRPPLEDLRGVAFLALLRGLAKFDQAAGRSLFSHLRQCINDDLCNAVMAGRSPRIGRAAALTLTAERRRRNDAGEMEEAAALLSRLDEDERRIVEMRFGLAGRGEIEIDQIAAAVGRPADEVDSALARAFEQLRRQVNEITSA